MPDKDAAPDVYVHVGYHRTGSTYLQQVVFPGVAGIRYILKKDHWETFQELCYRDPLSFEEERMREQFAALLSPVLPNLISDENLVGHPLLRNINNKNIADRLKRLFPTAKIIIVLRNQVDLIRSLYTQFVKGGGFLSLDHFIGLKNGCFEPSYQLFRTRINLDTFRFSSLVAYYRQQFGAENVHIFFYELMHEDTVAFLRDFFGVLGVPLDSTYRAPGERVNRSYGAGQLRVARVLNRFLWSRYNDNPYIPPFRLPGAGRLNAVVVQRLLEGHHSARLLGKSKVDFAPEVLERVRDYFRGDNRQLQELLGVALPAAYAR